MNEFSQHIDDWLLLVSLQW